MKTWEKVMLYALLPLAFVWHYAKKAGKYIARKSKPAIAMLVAVTMMLSLMPMTAFAARSYEVQIFVEDKYGAALAGATLQILDSDGKVITEWTSETNANEVKGLSVDKKYILHVVTAPAGLASSDLDSDNYFQIDKTGLLHSDGMLTSSAEGERMVFIRFYPAPHEHPLCGTTHTDIGNHTGTCENIEWTAVYSETDLINALQTGGNYYLADNITISTSGNKVASGVTVNLCLNGKTLTRETYGITVYSATLNICDCIGTGNLTGNTNAAPIYLYIDTTATLNLYGGNISGNTVSNDGAVSVARGTTFNMYGGSISNNSTSHGTVRALSTFRMYGGEISGNECTSGAAGGVYVSGTAIIEDGAVIVNNSSKRGGGGIHVESNGTVTINGGTITGNSAKGTGTYAGGGGISYKYGMLTVNGGIITGNTDANGDEDNVYIGTDQTITVGTLANNANIGVKLKNGTGTFTSGGAAYADKFTSDNSTYAVAVDGSNLKLVKQFTVSFDNNGGTGSKESVKISNGNGYTLPSNPFTAPSGYQFKGWAKSANGNVISAEAITVTADTTLYAIWEKIPAEAPSVQISENLTLTYGEFTNQKITAAVDKKDGYTYSYQWVNNDNRVIGETDTLNIADDTAAGIYNYACNVIAKRNDNGEYKAVTIRDIWVKVNAKAIDNNSANVILNQSAFIYNGQEQKPTMIVTYNGNHLTENTDYTLDWSADCKNAGGKTVTVNFMGNYSGSTQNTFAIIKAHLTVTADNKTIIYGEAPANNGVTYSGFAANESADVLGGTLEYDYSYTQYGDIGDYDITPKGLTSDNYEITFVKGTLTVEQREIGINWGATEFIPYNGSKQVPKVTAGNLVNNDSCELTVEVVETAEGAGIIPGRWNARITALSNGNYCLPKNGRLVQVDYSISKGNQNAPTVSGVAETVKGKADGKITGLTTEMEYATEFTADDDKYTKVTNVNMNFAPGTYYVRYQAKGYYNHSTFTEVTIGEGRKLKVTVPQNQIGYSLTTTTPEIDYYGSIHVEFKLNDGYSMTEYFEIYNGAEPIWRYFDRQTGVLEFDSVASDFALSVTGVADITAPTAQINVKNNKWSSFWNSLTFGLFFKETQDVTVTATDEGSGVKSIQYYLADTERELDEVRAITDWVDYNGTFKIDPNNIYVIYAKVTDNAGNTTFINSDGIVLDAVAPSVYGIEDGGVYYGDKIFKAMDDNFLKIELDGNDITDTTEGNDEFKIVADNAEHTVTVTDKAGNVTEYTVTVYKNYMVTFTDGDGAYEKNFKYGEVITIPNNGIFEDTFRKTGYTLTGWQGYTEGMTMPLENLTFTAVYAPNNYTVEFDANGGAAIDPINVIFGEKYGRLPSSSVAGLSGGDKNWYLTDENGNVTEINIKNLTVVSTARDHKLFIKRNVLAPNVSIALTVPGGISDGYQYYIPGASERVLTATVNNRNTELLNYTYQWYKDGTVIEGETSNVLTLDGNVADSGTYKVEVTATLKEDADIVVTTSAATGFKEQKVKILHAANTLSYEANGGEGGPQSAYTGGTSLNVSSDEPTREHYYFIGWNTKADGNGDSYRGEDAYTFTEDGGNGGCKITLYAQWKAKEYTVTYTVNGQTVFTEKVEYGKDATLPAIPEKEGYTQTAPTWDKDGKNITADTEINAVYTINVYTITFTDENGVYKILTVKHGEDVTMPEVPAKDGYTVTWETTIDKATSDASVKAVYTEIPKTDTPSSPQTGDSSNLWLWVALAFVSGGMLFGAISQKKKEEAKEN